MAKGSAFKWLLATAGGAVVGVLAVRAMDKYVLGKEKKGAKELEDAEEQQQHAPQQLAAPAGAPVVMPVMIPFPTPFAAMPPPQPQPPQLTPPAPIDTTAREPEDDEDVVASIEEEWEREGYG